jgi:chromosome segregation ATPase
MSRENSFSQPSQEGPGGLERKEMSIEELKAAQAKKDAEAVEAKRQKEAEEQRQKELEARTEADIEPRESALAELKMSQAEIDELKAARIEEKIANSEKLKESQAAKEAELQKLQAEFNRIENQLAEIQALTEGREEKDIAEEVKAALEQVQRKKAAIGDALQRLTQELDAMKAESVSDVQVQRYRELLKKMDELNAQVADIEANPYMIERLFAEAKTENEMRDNVVREAVGGVWRQPKETEIMAQVVQRFLTEEFEARGFNKIKDPKEREKAMREFTRAVASRVGGGADHGPYDFARLKKDELVGILLKNLVGKYGTMAGTEGFLGIASGGKKFDGSPQNDEVVGNYIRQHLGTINYLRANSFGLKTYSEAILGHRFDKYSWKAFDQNMHKYGLTAYEGKVIVPRDSDKNTRDKIEAEFQRNMKEIQDWEKAAVEEEKARLNAEISEAEIEVQRIKNMFSEASSARDFTEQARRENIYSADEAKRRLAEINTSIANLESRRTEAEEELNKLGVLSFRRKKELRNEISRIDYELTGYNGKRKQKDYLERLVKAYETGNHLKIDKLRDELIKAQEVLNAKKDRLARLTKAQGTK